MDSYQEIINTAFLLFSQNGYEATSMNEIAQTANLSKGALYHHFKSKKELLYKVFNYIMQKVLAVAFTDLNTLNKNNYKNILISLGIEAIETAQTNPTFKNFILEIVALIKRDDYVRKQMLCLCQKVITQFEQLIIRGIDLKLLSTHLNTGLTAQKMFMYLDALELYGVLKVPMDLKGLWFDFINDLFVCKK